MPYSELIKNYDNIREYMREFYVYGFKSRDEYTNKSARSYDDSRRRIESWLLESMSFRNTSDGKTVFISMDSRQEGPNPLFKSWKAKSFTDGDITLHFILFDILEEASELTLKQITDSIDRYSEGFCEARVYDESTVRKKLREYEQEGLIVSRREGRTVYYKMCPKTPLPSKDLLRFFSEVMPCGVIGSFIEDKLDPSDPLFRFKHHYITGTMDSEVMLTIFTAMRENGILTVTTESRRGGTNTSELIPLKVKISSQGARQHLLAFSLKRARMISCRIDHITKISITGQTDLLPGARKKLQSMEKNIWGVTVGDHIEHVEFDVRYGRFEEHIPARLQREKRCGKVTVIEDGLARFEADVYDCSELIPWIRTFIGRIVRISFSNKRTEQQFRDDLTAMYSLYEGGPDAVQ
ncbi:MAG: WYL domain-containing protein [Clostridiales bacterium]|nr:WYL domain-containing protein [Clostridiales bacterium]